MAIHIKIRKVLEKGDVGFYRIVTDYGGKTEFYVGFDKTFHKIYCFLTDSLSHSVRTIDLNDPNEIIGEVPGMKVEASVLAKVFRAAQKAFDLNEFPDYLDYCA